MEQFRSVAGFKIRRENFLFNQDLLIKVPIMLGSEVYPIWQY